MPGEFSDAMSSDPVILDVLASICKDALQLFERVKVVFDDKDGVRQLLAYLAQAYSCLAGSA